MKSECKKQSKPYGVAQQNTVGEKDCLELHERHMKGPWIMSFSLLSSNKASTWVSYPTVGIILSGKIKRNN